MNPKPEMEEVEEDDPVIEEHDVSDEDDDAPEDISFKKSKEDAISAFKKIKSNIQSLEEDAKLKRKQQEDRNIEQKKLKLSAHILKEVDQALKSKASAKDDCNDAEEENSSYDCITEEDFLTEATLTIQQSRQYQKPVNETAAQFKQNRLYGSRIRRVDAKQTKMLQSKCRNRHT